MQEATRAPRRHGGLTLVELLTACAIAAVVLGIGVPSFERFMLDARRTSHVNAFVRALHLARSTAIQRALPVAICRSSTGTQCTPGARDWSVGYIVFVNRDRDSPPRADVGEEILLVAPRVDHVAISANRDALLYWPVSLAGTTATISFCDRRGSDAARAVIVSHTGRPRIARRDASGRAIRCS